MCTAHLLRDLKYLTELYENPVSKQIGDILTKAIGLEKKMSVADYHQKNKVVIEIKEKFEQLIKSDIKHKKLKTFIKRMRNYKDYIFTFL